MKEKAQLLPRIFLQPFNEMPFIRSFILSFVRFFLLRATKNVIITVDQNDSPAIYRLFAKTFVKCAKYRILRMG